MWAEDGGGRVGLCEGYLTHRTRRARARSAIGNRKSAEEYDIWLRRLRNEAYVEYRVKTDADAAQKS